LSYFVLQLTFSGIPDATYATFIVDVFRKYLFYKRLILGQAPRIKSHSRTSHGFVLNGGTYTPINVPGAAQTVVEGVNNSGVVFGNYTDASGNTHGFIDAAGTFTSIDDPGAYFTTVAGVNDSGQIVGFAYFAPQTTATPEPTSLTLLVIGGVCSLAYCWRRKRPVA